MSNVVNFLRLGLSVNKAYALFYTYYDKIMPLRSLHDQTMEFKQIEQHNWLEGITQVSLMSSSLWLLK